MKPLIENIIKSNSDHQYSVDGEYIGYDPSSTDWRACMLDAYKAGLDGRKRIGNAMGVGAFTNFKNNTTVIELLKQDARSTLPEGVYFDIFARNALSNCPGRTVDISIGWRVSWEAVQKDIDLTLKFSKLDEILILGTLI